MSAGTGGLSRDAEQLVRTIGSQADTAANTTEFVRAWVVDEVDGMVQIRLGDEVGVSSGDTARYRRLAGPPLTPGQAVQCVRVPGGYIVLGAIQQGAGDLAGIRVEKGGVAILTTRTTRAIDLGTGLLATAEDAAAPDTDTDEINVSIDFGTGAGQVPDASTVQRQLTLWSSPAAGGAIASIVTNPNLLVAQDAGGLVVTTPNGSQADLAVNWGTPAGTDATKVPRNSETARRFDVNQDTTLVLNNPDHFRIGDGLTATVDGNGVRLDASSSGGSFPTPWSALQSGQTWVSAHSSFPMRNQTSAAFALAASTAYGTFVVWPERAEYDSLAFRVTTAGAAGAVARISVFRFDPVTLTVTLMDRTGNVPVDTVGWKNVDFGWGIQSPGIFVVFLIASAAVTINGLAANALASSPVPNLNYAPATAYVAGSAPPIPQGILRAQAFGDLPTPWVMSASHFVATALPVGWLLATRRPL